ncbi:MAG: gamma-glutamyltransferase, partial [Rhizobacter sp.]|nr:gamma-glutamyltransferase [Rhizobacter sp.]
MSEGTRHPLPWLLSSVAVAVLMAGCGGGGESLVANSPSDAGPNAHATSAVVPSAASVVSVEKVSETRISRTVYDYVFKVSVQNGSVAQNAVKATLTAVAAGASIVDGTSVVGTLAANASGTSADTVTVRQDRSFSFNADAFVWSVTGTPAQTVVFDPSRCTPQAGAPYGQTVGITGTHMMVTSADIQASTAGCKVLASGGTAIDATIAVQAVLGVAEPFASGLGGGSVITYYDAASKKVHAYDGLSSAPATTGGMPDIYKAVDQDVATSAPYNLCKSGLAKGASISAQQGN